MKIFAGVDGGQSSTTALVGDEAGRVLGRGVAGPADDVGRTLADSARSIDAAIGAALADAGADASARLERIVVGLSGFDGSRAGAPALRTIAGDVAFLHDSDVAHAGAFAGGPGIVVIAGTGSAALGVSAAGERVLAGGWGYLFGDEGSAFWLGRRAVSAAMAQEDRGRATALRDAALTHLGQKTLRDVQHGCAAGSIPRPELASLAVVVCRLAAEGVADAAALVAEAADALARLAATVATRLGEPDAAVSYHGGVFAGAGLLARFNQALHAHLPHAELKAPAAGAADGALLLAMTGRVPARSPAAAGTAASRRIAPRSKTLDRLRGGLIVSVQAEEGSAIGSAATIAQFALAAVRNGAAGVRIEGAERIAHVRAVTDAPVVGIVKRRHAGYEPYITSSIDEVAEACAAGADAVAFDATRRQRAGGASVADLVAAAHRHGVLAMADCSTADDGRAAAEAGADIVATTLAGYTGETAGRALPALDVVAALVSVHPFVICEGGVASPADARAARSAGAAAVVVGTAITNVDALVRRFVAATRGS